MTDQNVEYDRLLEWARVNKNASDSVDRATAERILFEHERRQIDSSEGE